RRVWLRLKLTRACAIMFSPNEHQTTCDADGRPGSHHAGAKTGTGRRTPRDSFALARQPGRSSDGRRPAAARAAAPGSLQGHEPEPVTLVRRAARFSILNS